MIVQVWPIAPDVRDLAAMLPPKKVISNSPSRSRSPSPQAHKHLAKTVSRPKQQFFEVYDDVEVKIGIEQILYRYEDTRVVT